MPYRFVHAADIHLDSPLRSLALRDPELADLIGNATRRAFAAIVDLCLDEQVDALLLAGDLYDGDQTSMKTARFLATQILRLDQAGIRVFIIRGNHDALSKITKELSFPPSVKIFSGRAEAVMHERTRQDFAVVVHGISFAQPNAPESLLSKYRMPTEDAVNIGLMHTSLGGTPDHDLYAPCSVADLDAAGFHYWALGHIHQRDVPKAGRAIVMPGMPQGRDINEAGAKSVTLVTIGDDRSVTLDKRHTSVAQFERVRVPVDGVEDWRTLVAALAQALEKARDAAVSEHLVARVSLVGRTPLAWQIRRDADLLKTEADHRASVIGKSWIEKIEIACSAPRAAAGPSLDPRVELRALIADEIAGSDAYQAIVMTLAEGLRDQLPPECRGILGADEASFKAMIARIVSEGTEDVLARLHAPGGDGSS